MRIQHEKNKKLIIKNFIEKTACYSSVQIQKTEYGRKIFIKYLTFIKRCSMWVHNFIFCQSFFGH